MKIPPRDPLTGRYLKARVLKDKDNGLAKRLAQLKAAAQKTWGVTVGIHEEKGSETHDEDSGLTIAQIGEIHELGLGVPRRSFIADWVDENRDQIQANFRKVGEAVVQGKIASIEQGMNRLGLLFVGQIQRRIVNHIPPPLAQSTIDRKGSSTPLIDEGILKSAITYEVWSK